MKDYELRVIVVPNVLGYGHRSELSYQRTYQFEAQDDKFASAEAQSILSELKKKNPKALRIRLEKLIQVRNVEVREGIDRIFFS